MKVYHASRVIVEHPDTLHSRSYLDFGPGFYVTTLEQQAIDYGQRFIRRGKEAWLNMLCVALFTRNLITNSVSVRRK